MNLKLGNAIDPIEYADDDETDQLVILLEATVRDFYNGDTRWVDSLREMNSLTNKLIRRAKEK